jgi:hypothetical protein
MSFGIQGADFRTWWQRYHNSQQLVSHQKPNHQQLVHKEQSVHQQQQSADLHLQSEGNRKPSHLSPCCSLLWWRPHG